MPVTTKPETTRQITRTEQRMAALLTRITVIPPQITVQPMTQAQEAERPAQATAW